MNDPTIFPVLIVTAIIAVIAWFQNMKWVSGAVIAGSIVYFFLFGTAEAPMSTDLAEGIILTDESPAEPEKRTPEVAVPVVSDTDTVQSRPEQVAVQIQASERSGFSPILVNEIVICREVSGRQPIGPGDRFPSTIESISCFTSIRNLNPDKQKIIHEWRLNGALMSQVPMELYFSFNWRCWSQVTLDPEREGTWTVSVLDTAGNVLDETAFTVVSEDLY